jgi:flagellar assembly factor FliW
MFSLNFPIIKGIYGFSQIREIQDITLSREDKHLVHNRNNFNVSLGFFIPVPFHVT